MKESKKDRSKKTECLPSKQDETSEEYLYRAAGIRERKGYIPLWLILVTIGLFIWGAYYLYSYWSPVS